MVAQDTTISQLPVQLLARILAVLRLPDRLGSAALVATAWHTAAVLGTDRVCLEVCRMSQAVPKWFDSLSAWLATNSNAGITGLWFHMYTGKPTSNQDDEMPVLQLPSLQRLPGLECLFCRCLAITAAQASSEARAAVVPEGKQAAEETEEATLAATLLPLELSPATALTELKFYFCNVTVQGLNALTRLQSLTLATSPEMNHSAATASNFRTQLQQAPQLQALTSLCLIGEVAHDDVLQHVGSLSRLQDLTLVNGTFTPAGFQQLPQSLTNLVIDWATNSTVSKTLNASTAPGLCQLTALQDLDMRSGAIGLDLLASLTSLTSMDLIQHVRLEGPGTLSVLTALTKLKRMQLLSQLDAALVPTDQELAAVTASPQLQFLNINRTHLDAAACRHMFPAGRQLTQLNSLCASLDMIHDGREAAFVAACCPNLDTIFLTESKVDDWVAEEEYIVAGDLASMLVSWQSLQHLNHLSIDVQHLPMMPEVWQALAGLTQLRHIKVSINKLEYLAGVLNLTRCIRLKSLCVDARSMEGLMERVWFDMRDDEAADGSTDLAQQLPKFLQQSILQQVSEDNGTPELLAVLARCAADVQQAQEQQLAQQQGEIAQLRQELRGVQASLAAVLQQLKGLVVPGAS